MTQVTLWIDDALLAEARALSRIEDASTVVNEALRALVARDGSRRLARLGGSEPELTPPPRRRANVGQ
jgi:Arc/MetJ family transcription regulator